MDRFYVGNSPLVNDLGMNNGDDANYYFKKDHKVVAVKVNPTLAEQGCARFANATAGPSDPREGYDLKHLRQTTFSHQQQ